MDTNSNPAHDASSGLCQTEFSKPKWIKGPEFFCKKEAEWQVPLPEAVTDFKLIDYDLEVKKAVSLATEVSLSWPNLVDQLKYFSDWHHARKAVALCRCYI